MNPCRCGYLGDLARACFRAPECRRTYCARVSGPMLDRFDMVIEVAEVSGQLLLDQTPGEATSAVARRVADAQGFAGHRAPAPGGENDTPLRDVTSDATSLLELAIEKKSLSARGFHRVQRVARTIADLQQQTAIGRGHLAEAVGYRTMPLLA